MRKSGFPPAALHDPGTQIRRHLLADQLVDRTRLQRLQPNRDRPLRAAVGKLRTRHADEQDRRPRRQQGRALDEVEEAFVAPLDIVENHDEGACSSRSLRKAQAICSAVVPAAVSPSSERMAAAAAGSEGRASSCLITPTTGQ